MTTPNKIIIPSGWTALYHPVEKKAYVYKHFISGGKATGTLSAVSAETQELLDVELLKLGISPIPVTIEQAKPTK